MNKYVIIQHANLIQGRENLFSLHTLYVCKLHVVIEILTRYPLLQARAASALYLKLGTPLNLNICM